MNTAGNRAKRAVTGVGRRLKQMSGLNMVFTAVLIIVAVVVIAVVWRSLSTTFSKSNPMLLSGPANAFGGDAGKKGHTVPLPSSGLGFTYSMWLYVQDWRKNYGMEKVVLVKSSSPQNIKGAQFSVCLGSTENNLHVHVGHVGGGSSGCPVSNFPLQKWVHVCVVVNNRTTDVYIDGKLERSCVSSNVPRVHGGQVFICPQDVEKGYAGGYFGQISRVQYFSSAIDPAQVMDVYANGPSTSGGLGNLMKDASSHMDKLMGTGKCDLSHLKKDF